MRLHLPARFVSVLAACLLAAACTDDSYDPLIEEYNENFTVVEDTAAASFSVNEEGFDASSMLRDLYTVSRKTMTIFSIVGPQDGVLYRWSLCESESGEAVELSGVDMEARTFSLYLPESPLKAQTLYTLGLSVTGGSGQVFEDTGRIWIEAD